MNFPEDHHTVQDAILLHCLDCHAWTWLDGFELHVIQEECFVLYDQRIHFRAKFDECPFELMELIQNLECG